jgi:hypothetical protein
MAAAAATSGLVRLPRAGGLHCEVVRRGNCPRHSKTEQ